MFITIIQLAERERGRQTEQVLKRQSGCIHHYSGTILSDNIEDCQGVVIRKHFVVLLLLVNSPEKMTPL